MSVSPEPSYEELAALMVGLVAWVETLDAETPSCGGSWG